MGDSGSGFYFLFFGFPFSQLSSRLSFELGHEFGIAFSELNDFFFFCFFLLEEGLFAGVYIDF